MAARRVAITLTLLLVFLGPAAWEACGLCTGCPAGAQRPAPACHEAPASTLTSDCCAAATAGEPALPGAVAASPATSWLEPAPAFSQRFAGVAVPLAVAMPPETAPAAVPLFTLHSALLI